MQFLFPLKDDYGDLSYSDPFGPYIPFYGPGAQMQGYGPDAAPYGQYQGYGYDY